MILEIRLSNFFSIKEEIVLDLRAANIKSKNAKALKNNITKFDKTPVLKCGLATLTIPKGRSGWAKTKFSLSTNFSILCLFSCFNQSCLILRFLFFSLAGNGESMLRTGLRAGFLPKGR